MRVAVYANGIRRALAKVVFYVLYRLSSSLGSTAGVGRPGVSSSRVVSRPLHGCLCCPWNWFRLSVVVVSLRDAYALLITVHPIRACPRPELQLGDARGRSWPRRDSPDEAVIAGCG